MCRRKRRWREGWEWLGVWSMEYGVWSSGWYVGSGRELGVIMLVLVLILVLISKMQEVM